MELEELEAQRNPDLTKIEKIWDGINKLEREIQNKEILHEKKIRELLTGDQKALLDSYSTYDANFYGRGGFGRGNIGRGYGRYGAGVGQNYMGRGVGVGQNNMGRGAGIGQNYMGRGAGMLNRGYYGYGNAVTGSYGRNMGTNPYLRGVRYGRGPCGAGLGRWSRMGYGQGRWYR